MSNDKLLRAKEELAYDNFNNAFKVIDNIIKQDLPPFSRTSFEDKWIALSQKYHESEKLRTLDLDKFTNEKKKVFNELKLLIDDLASQLNVSLTPPTTRNIVLKGGKNYIWMVVLIVIVTGTYILLLFPEFFAKTSTKPNYFEVKVLDENFQPINGAKVTFNQQKFTTTGVDGIAREKIDFKSGDTLMVNLLKTTYQSDSIKKRVFLNPNDTLYKLTDVVLKKPSRSESQLLPLLFLEKTKDKNDTKKTGQIDSSQTDKYKNILLTLPKRAQEIAKRISDKVNRIPVRLHYDDLIFTGPAGFSNIVFEGGVYFNAMNFKAKASFDQSVFFDFAYFGNSVFWEQCDFSKSRFIESFVEFENSSFKQKTDFSRVNFESCHFVNFQNTTFDTCFVFENVLFDSTKVSQLMFDDAKFNKDVKFKETVFPRYVKFRGATFRGSVDFDNVKASRVLDFSNASFTGKSDVSFINCILPDTLILDNVKLKDLKGKVDFSKAFLKNPSKKCVLSVTNIDDLTKIKLAYKDFVLWFPENYDRLPERKMHIYELMLETLKKEKLNKSSQELEIQYKKFRNEQDLRYKLWSWIKNKVNEIWWNFGFDREKVFIVTIILFLTFSLINFFSLQVLLSQVYPIESIATKFQRITNEYKQASSATSINWRGLFFTLVFLAAIFPLRLIGLFIRWLIRLNSGLTNFLAKFSFFTFPNEIILDPLLIYVKDRAYLSLYYTGMIFFGLRVEINHLDFKGRFWMIKVSYFFIIYILGLISLAYMINYVVVNK